MSSFKKRADFFLTSKWVLLFLFVVSICLLIGFAMTRNVFGIVLLTLIGFLTSFFSKNMIVIFLISIGLTGVILGMYPVEMRRKEGFGEESDSDEEEEVIVEEEVVIAKKKKPDSKKNSESMGLEDIQKILKDSQKYSQNDDLSDSEFRKKVLDIYKETMQNIVEKNKKEIEVSS